LKQCLITGGAGFIGSHLVEALIAQGHKVTVIDNFSNGREQNIEFSRKSGNLSVIQADVSDHSSIAPYFKDIDWVFHLAALADIVPSIQYPFKYHQANVNGTISVLEAVRQNRVKRFVYAASSSCYGIPDVYPTPESAQIRPMYPYALTKYLGEQYVMHWAQTYQLPVISLRMFNVYGPRSRTSGTYGAVFGVFLAQKLAGKPFTVVGDGTQTRDFTYVTDVTEAFIRAAESNLSGQIFNIGSGGTYSVNELVGYLGGPVEYIPKRPGEPDCTFADISRITTLLGWKPKVGFQEGVHCMLESIELWKDAPVWNKESIADATKDWFQYLGKTDERYSYE
jgi:UDP-glucose 4-epimerase